MCGDPSYAHVGEELACDGVPLCTLADQFGTPLYVYALGAVEAAYAQIDRAMAFAPHSIAYAMKANDSPAILARLVSLGSGVDIVSGGELAHALKAGFHADAIVYSGVGKRDDEIESALRANILSIHVESESELHVIAALATGMNRRARIAFRVNPDIDSGTHPYVATGHDETKFGMTIDAAQRLVEGVRSSPALELEGLACHIGSQLPSPVPLCEAVRKTAELALELRGRGLPIRRIDVGGGWPLTYGNEPVPFPPLSAYGDAIAAGLRLARADSVGFEVTTEPGRALVGEAGVLLTRVLHVKEQGARRFVIVDAGMTELIRPALYGAYHRIEAVTARSESAALVATDVVGPVCETADFFAVERPLPPLARGDLVAIRTAGAYGRVMASNYNARPRAAEVVVDHGLVSLARARETVDDLFRGTAASAASSAGRIRA